MLDTVIPSTSPRRAAEAAPAGAAPSASGASIAYWKPAPALARYVSGYHRYEVFSDTPETDVFFPAWSNIRFSFDAAPWSIRLGRRRFDPVPSNALFGPTSHAGVSQASRGRLIGAGITPAGWARLFGSDASAVADRVQDLGKLFPDVVALREPLASRHPPDIFDAFFLARLEATPPEDPRIEQIFRRLADPAVAELEQLAGGLGIGTRQLARLSRTAFGFTPKLLLRRARFLRALSALRDLERGAWMEAVRAAGYWDGSHFNRDCTSFLGMPLGQFMRLRRPLNRASAELRSEVLGAPMQALHQTGAAA